MPITPTNPFKGRQYPGELILLCVRMTPGVAAKYCLSPPFREILGRHLAARSTRIWVRLSEVWEWI